MKVGETWRARPNTLNDKHPGMQRITIANYVADENWHIEREDGEWEIWTSSYIFENYERDYETT